MEAYRFFIWETFVAKTYAGNIIRNLKKEMLQAAIDTLYDAATDITGNLRDVVRTWKNKPDFTDVIELSEKRLEVLIKPKGNKKVVRIFNYVDKGTKGPYLIPKFLQPGRMLRFQPGYSAMTQPVAKYNVGSGRSFGGWVSKKQVVHPGIKGRGFIDTFWKELAPPLEVRMQKNIDRRLA